MRIALVAHVSLAGAAWATDSGREQGRSEGKGRRSLNLKPGSTMCVLPYLKRGLAKSYVARGTCLRHKVHDDRIPEER